MIMGEEVMVVEMRVSFGFAYRVREWRDRQL